MKLSKNLGDWKLDIETHLINFSPLKAAALGYGVDEIPEYVTYDFFIEKIYIEEFSKVRDLFLELILGKIDAFDVEYRTRTKNRGSRWFREICQVTTRSETGKPLIATGVTWDITDEKYLESPAEDALEHDASDETDAINAKFLNDQLTQISNRQGIMEKLQLEVDKSLSNTMFLSVALCKINNFDRINTVDGHIFGDYLLIRISDIMKDGLSDDDNIGRYDSDQFMIILPSTPREIATETLAQIITKIENYAFSSTLPIRISFVIKEYLGESMDAFIEALEQGILVAPFN